MQDDLRPLDEQLSDAMKRHGQAPKVMSHLFVAGDPAYGWERQCNVKVPVPEGGEIVGACCGAAPEDHIQTTG